ncbi:glycosyltransferase family 2 protein [Marinobacter sp. GN3S48]|uniref:glycosyltransferase family 2 protein n=1 Tax=Marinobacter sp. GN3S48 TaxID=3382302 RepID=UPI00387A97EF
MDKPLVTVIVPAYNASDFIAETLESILNQTYDNLQVIVVDDGSTDDTARIVQSYSPRVNYIHQANSGGCAAPRNRGLKHAQGEFVTFFDADDIMLPDKLTRQVDALTQHPNAVMCITNYCNFTGTERSTDHMSTCPTMVPYLDRYKNSDFTLGSEECRSILISENFTIASAPLFKTKIIKRLGGFDQSLKSCEDFHLIYRAAMHGDIIVSPNVGFERRLHDTNMSNDNERMLRNLIASRRDLSLSEPNAILKRRLQHRVRRYWRNLQSCLVTKSQLASAIKMYKETFPPKSLSDLNHDIRQAIKISLYSLPFRKHKDEQHSRQP